MDLQTRRRGRAWLLLQQRKEVARPEGELLRVEKLGVAIAGEAKESKLAGGCVDGEERPCRCKNDNNKQGRPSEQRSICL